MEADWEVEVGGDSPIIEAAWAGLIDLRQSPECAFELPEAKHLPGLGQALVNLNAPDSPVWTSKCDVWEIDSFDADELDARPDEAVKVIGCYVDMVRARAGAWSPLEAVSWSNTICVRLKEQVLRRSRVDLVIRRLSMPGMSQTVDCGVTAYVTACGATLADATARLGFALQVLVGSVWSDVPPAVDDQKLQYESTGE